MTIADRLAAVRATIDAAAAAAGRSPAEVRLLLATKTVEPARIVEALTAGAVLIAENRVQEVVAKAPALAAHRHENHFIGHLQSNKVNAVVGLISCLETLDSEDLARRLDDRLRRLDDQLDVFIQVNVSGEESKSGVAPDRVAEFADAIGRLERLRLRGFMTIGLNSPDLTAVRHGYAQLREIRDRLAIPGADELSMGMSGDFEVAIAEGATIVRLGSAVFGERPAR